MTTFYGHFNAWGTGEWVDFRVQRPGDMAAAIRHAARLGAVTACNHPKPYGPPWDYPDVGGYDLVEVWNGPWDLHNEAALAFWTAQLSKGKRIPASGGSDFHRTNEQVGKSARALGRPTLWVFVPGMPGEAAILQALAAGHASLSAEPDGPFLDLRGGPDNCAVASAGVMGGDTLVPGESHELSLSVYCRQGSGGTLRFLDQRGVLAERTISSPEETVSIALPLDRSLYVRAELRSPDGAMAALTNPIYTQL